MTEANHVIELFDTLAKILLRCFVLAYALLLIWFAVSLSGGGVIYGIGKWYGLTPHEVDLLNYGGMTFVKCTALLFFLFPFVAIRLVIRKRT